MTWYDPILAIINLANKKPTANQWYAALQAIANQRLEDHFVEDTTINNATTAKHGLMPKLDGFSTHFYRSDGAQAVPAGVGIGLGGVTGAVDGAILLADGVSTDTIKTSSITIVTTLGADDTTVPTSKAVGDSRASKTQVSPMAWLPQQMNFDNPPSMGGTGATMTYEKLSNGIVQAYMEFTNTTVQYVFLEGIFPKDWDTGTVDVTAFVRWKSASSSTNKVKWKIYGKRFTSGATRNFAVTDLLATIEQANDGAEYQNESPETTLVDMTGTGRNFVLMITRDYATESPSLAASAGLLSVEIYCTRTLA